MYAIVENGSKQYKAEVGSVIRFEKLEGEVGAKVEFPVLMISDENVKTLISELLKTEESYEK